MTIFRHSIQILSILPLIALAGCGEGWEVQPYDGTPYGERTAGRGVEYVRAKMAPQKGPVLEQAKTESIVTIQEPVITPPPAAATPADPVFNTKIRK